MHLEVAPLWTNNQGHEHLAGYQLIAVDYLSGFRTVDQIATYATEHDAHNAKERILQAAPLADD